MKQGKTEGKGDIEEGKLGKLNARGEGRGKRGKGRETGREDGTESNEGKEERIWKQLV